MWRLLSIFVAVAALSTLALSHSKVAAAPAAKQFICHVTNTSGAHIIEVATAAVPAHLREHGDCLINSTNRSLIGNPCDPTDANGNDICDIQP